MEEEDERSSGRSNEGVMEIMEGIREVMEEVMEEVFEEGLWTGNGYEKVSRTLNGGLEGLIGSN